mgnify:CR=1 FL=1
MRRTSPSTITSTSAADANHYRLDSGNYVSLATKGRFEGVAVMCTTSSGTVAIAFGVTDDVGQVVDTKGNNS